VGDNHHHVVCRSCGAISDVDCVIGDPPCVAPADAGGFVIDEAEVTFWGLCPDCRTNPEQQDKERGDDRPATSHHDRRRQPGGQ
jgi:Fur family transcriptional regulator, stress-responsive regulator